MYSNAKNTANYLVLSKESAIFVLPNVHYSSDQVHISGFRNKAGLFCGAIHHVNSGRLATKTGEARLFCYIYNQTFRLCQTSLKVASRYKVSTLRLLHLYPKSRVLQIKSSTTGNAIGFLGTSTGPDSPKFRKSTWSTSTDRSLAVTSNSRATTFLSKLSMMKSIQRSLSVMLSSSSCTNIRERISMTLLPLSA